MLFKTIIFFFVFLFIAVSNDNDNDIPELESLLKEDLRDDDRISTLIQLSNHYKRLLPVKALDYAFQALYIIETKELNEDKLYTLTLIGDLHYITLQYQSSQNYYFEALNLVNKQTNKLIKANLLNKIGIVNTGLEEYNSAKNYFFEANSIFKKLKDTNLIVQTYNNLATVYWKTKKKDSANYFYNTAFEINKSRNDLFGLLESYSYLGKINLEEGKYYEALEYFSRSLTISEDIDNEEFRARTLSDLGRVFYGLEKYKDSELNLKSAIDLSEVLGSFSIKLDSYYYLSKLYSKTGENEKAFKYLNLYYENKDSLFSRAIDKQISSLQREYLVQKKDYEISILSQENEFNKKLTILYFILLILFAALLIMLLTRYRLKRKISKELSSLNKKLNSKNKELELLNATKDKIFTIIAHDLKNPLSGFRNVTSVIVDYYNDMSDEEIKESLSQVRDVANNLMLLLENLLTWSKLQKGEIETRKEKIALNFILEKYIESFSETARKKNIKIDYLKNGEVFAYCDPNQISFIIKNLLSNALKFSPKNKNINIKLYNKDNSAKLTIDDQGIGIDKNILDTIFKIDSVNVNYGTDGERGTGLGLIISNDFIKMNDGSIIIESESKKGTSVQIVLPAKY